MKSEKTVPNVQILSLACFLVMECDVILASVIEREENWDSVEATGKGFTPC